MVHGNPFAGMSRRKFLAAAMATSGAALLNDWAGPVIETAHARSAGGTGRLDDIEHVVLLMQENRSFDHYFGTMRGVRGFGEASPAWNQRGWTPGRGPTPDGYLNPFRLDTNRGPTLDGECINDPTHSWPDMHRAWNGGANDNWMPMAVAANGPANAPAAMGYYTREDIPVHWALADAWTICDNYHCSVMGPTDPNRLYWMSGTIDPDGRAGGPLVDTPTLIPKWAYSWRTMPENLEEAGVSWKIYNNKDFGPISSVALDGMMGCFKQAQDPASALHRKGIAPSFPHSFRDDVINGTLPSVSWIIPSLVDCEHPALPPAFGATGILHVLDILTMNPAVWEKTALIVSYDENGGFFDHVTPPTPPPGTPGEFLTVPMAGVPKAEGVTGPIGLGYRVPGLVISPFSTGGLVFSDVSDHTSQLQLIERRWGVDVPNLTPWRRGVTSDMTGAFDFGGGSRPARPPLPDGKDRLLPALAQCHVNVGLGTADVGIPYAVPPNQMPAQEPGERRRPSGVV